MNDNNNNNENEFTQIVELYQNNALVEKFERKCDVVNGSLDFIEEKTEYIEDKYKIKIDLSEPKNEYLTENFRLVLSQI